MLFTTYGDIDHDALKEEEEEEERVYEIIYYLYNPITDNFEPIHELEQLLITGKLPYTQSHLVEDSVAVISNTNNIETAPLN